MKELHVIRLTSEEHPENGAIGLWLGNACRAAWEGLTPRRRRSRQRRDIPSDHYPFAPMGPWVTTPDEIPDPNTLRVEGYVDGEQFSSDTTASYTYSVPQLVAEASRYFTLEPGDIINCGTSAKGVGNYPRAHRNINFQERECAIDIEIEGLGRLSHSVIHG